MRLHGAVFNKLSTGTTLPLLKQAQRLALCSSLFLSYPMASHHRHQSVSAIGSGGDIFLIELRAPYSIRNMKSLHVY
jgi:hypothetical protein